VANSRGQVTIRNSELPAGIKDAPRMDLNPLKWTDGRFFEYENTGPGATINANRPLLTNEQAVDYTAEKYLAGSDGWDPVGE
jgi:pectin methylesterase-like acyl-CoA thioesterase